MALSASHLQIYCDRQLVATHERLHGKGQSQLLLDHYLEILLRKPGRCRIDRAGPSPRRREFTPMHDAWWAAARKAHGDAAGTRG